MITKFFPYFIAIYIGAGILKSPLAQKIEIVPQLGHFKAVNCLIFSPDSSYFVSAGDDGQIKIWEQVSGLLMTSLSVESRPVLSLAFHPDGKLLYSGDKNGWICTWDISSGKLLKSIQGPVEGVYSLSCSPDGTTICSGSGYGAVQLWNLATMTLAAELQGIVRLVSNVAFSPDGTKLAFTIGDFDLKIWDMVSMVEVTTFSGHSGEIYNLAFSHSGDYIATGGKDGQLILWNLSSRVIQQIWEVGTTINAIQFSGDDHSIITGTSGKGILIFPVGKTGYLKSVPGGDTEIKALAAKNKRIFSGASDGIIRMHFIDNQVEALPLALNLKKSYGIFPMSHANALVLNQGPWIAYYDRERGKITHSFQTNSDVLFSLIMSKNDDYIASLTPSSTLNLIDVKQNQDKQPGSNDLKLSCLAFHPIRPLLAAGAKNGVIWLWDLQREQVVFQFKIHDRTINNLLFDASGKYLVSAGRDSKIRITNVEDPEDYREFIHDTYNFTSLCFTNNDLSLVSGTDEGTLIELDFASLRLRFQDSPHKRRIHILNYCDNKLLVGSMDQTLTIWDWTRRVLEQRIDAGASGINHARLLDANNLAIAGDDGLIKFYNLPGGTLKVTFALINNETFFAWSPDSRFSSSPDAIKYLVFKKDFLLTPALNYPKSHSVMNLDELLEQDQ